MKKLSRLNKIPRMLSTHQLLVGCAALGFSSSVLAVCTPTSTVACIADQPIQSATIVKPNVMFILDNSGSMVWDVMSKDSALSGTVNTGKYCRENFNYNTLYYNPNTNYTELVPKDSTNTSMGSQSFTNAKDNPFATTSSYSNLSLYTSAGFCAEGETQTCSTATATAINSYQTDPIANPLPPTKYQPAFYYKYIGGTGSPGSACDTNNAHYTGASRTYTRVIVGANSCEVSTPAKPSDVKFCHGPETPPGSGKFDERENFANWYSYFRTRILMMKSGMSSAFSTIDDKIRVGFHTINNPDSGNSSGRSLNIADFAATQKNAWYTALWSIAPSGGTPLQDALSRVGNYFSNSGTKTGLSGDPVQYSCQKNFTILSTDGYWNNNSASVGNMDKTVPASMPIAQGKTAYDPTDTGLTPSTPFPRLPMPFYEGSTASSNSLADVAMYYWVKDLRSMDNNVPTTSSDPAYWQHMNTFTVGLGVDGTLIFPDDLVALKAGTKNWPVPAADTTKAIDDLWHAAINGHGEYYQAKNPESLSNSLNSALKAVSNVPLYHSPSSSTRDFKSPNQSDFTTYVPTYRLINWSGDVSKYAVEPTTGMKTGDALWSAAYQLDSKVNPGLTSTVNTTAYTTRNIVTRDEAGTVVAFTYPTLSTAQQGALCYPVAITATGSCAGNTTLVDYLRGDATWEGDYGTKNASGIAFRYRNRQDKTESSYHKRSLIGTIINAGPVYVAVDPHNYQNAGFQNLKNTSRSPTVYAPANDGMVHALDAATGNELWAYVPSFVIPTGSDVDGKEKGLRALSYQDSGDPAYAPHYYVDATPEVGAVCKDSSCAVWANILVGGLGKGGKGYYALDVTTPATTLDSAKRAVKWEFPDTANVNKMGYSFGRPLIVNTARWGWVVILPSGYNNGDGLGHIFVLNAYTGELIKTNGLTDGTMSTTAPNLVNISALGNVNDGMVSEAYGSDLGGNIWRFDFGTLTVKQLFSSSTSTPITSEMNISIDGNTDTRWVFFGTGQYLDVPDRSSTGTQYLVALNDGTSTAPRTTSGVITLASLTSTSPSSGLASCPALGWKYALPTSGERVVTKPDADLRTVVFTSLIPTTDACSPGTSSYTYGLDYCTGASRLKINGATVASIFSPGGAGGVTFQGTGNSTNSSGKPQLVIHTIDGKTSRVDLDTSRIYSGTRHVGWRELLNEY